MDRYLIDTNILVQFATEQDFTNDVRYILFYSDAQIYVSSECVKEFINLLQCEDIKPQKQSGLNVFNVCEFIEDALGFTIKYIDKGHLQQLCKMELVKNHTDSSDRLIIAQAITEKIPLISSDRKFPKYRKQGLDLIPNF